MTMGKPSVSVYSNEDNVCVRVSADASRKAKSERNRKVAVSLSLVLSALIIFYPVEELLEIRVLSGRESGTGGDEIFVRFLAKWRGGPFSLVESSAAEPSFLEDENALKSGENQECGA